MAGLPGPSFETDREQITALITNRAPELSPSPTAFAGEQGGALAQLTQGIGGSIDRAARDAVPSSDSSSAGLDRAAVAWGISNGTGPGGYGRRGATYAQGATGYLLGDATTSWIGGTQKATAGNVTLVLRSTVTVPGISGTGQVLGTWDADTTSEASAGVAGNLPAGTQLFLQSPPSGSSSTLTLQTGMAIEGQDQESNSSLLTRILNKMQRPPNGGNGTDYRDWAENATDGAGAPVSTAQLFAFVYPNYYGDGTPLVVVLQSGSGTARQLSNAELTEIQTYIAGSTAIPGQEPVASDAVVLTGYMPAQRALVCRLRTVAAPGYQYDWVVGTAVYTVFSKTTAGLPGWATSVGANVLLELNTLAPISLKDAIDAGSQPHVQVDTRTGSTLLGPVVPEQWPCLAYQDAGGRTTVALKVPCVPNFDAWTQVTNRIFSGGPIVSTVAASALSAIDAIGPSRLSGLADRAQIWQDVVGVTTLSTAAESALANDGTTRLVLRCIAGGVTIGIGPTGAQIAQDVAASDNTINGPEVLFAGRMLVTD